MKKKLAELTMVHAVYAQYSFNILTPTIKKYGINFTLFMENQQKVQFCVPLLSHLM